MSRLLLMHRTKNGLALLRATIRLCNECWNWAPTVVAFLTFLWTTRRLSPRTDWWLTAEESVAVDPEAVTASFSCEEDALEAATDDEVNEELLWPSRPANVLTVSKLRQFFGRLLVFDTLFLRLLSPFPLPVRLSWPEAWISSRKWIK